MLFFVVIFVALTWLMHKIQEWVVVDSTNVFTTFYLSGDKEEEAVDDLNQDPNYTIPT